MTKGIASCLTLAVSVGSCWGITPVEALQTALAGPKVAFFGEQTSSVPTDQGTAKASVRLFANGKGGLRREYETPTGTVVLLQLPDGSFTRAQNSRWVATPRGPSSDAASVAATIAKNYSVTIQERQTLLGRSCVAIRIDPKSSFNPKRRIWCEIATGIALKDELYDSSGQLRSSSVFTSIKVGPQPASLFEKPAEASAQTSFGPESFRPVSSEEELKRITGRAAPRPKHIPPGYAPISYGTMATAGRWTMPAVRYSDGLASFTIFQRGQGRGGRGWGQGGPNTLRSDRQRAVFSVQRPSGNYILIGDLAESELRLIGQSLP